MTSYDFEQAVAQATGESRREIRRRGFQPLLFGPEERPAVNEESVRTVDRDDHSVERTVFFP